MRAETKVRYGRLIMQLTLMFLTITGALALWVAGAFGQWSIILGGVAAMLAIAWWVDFRRERLWREVCDTNFASCLKCAYDLRDSGQRGACPECGEPFVLKETKDRWMNTRSDEGPDDDDSPDVYW